MRENTFKQINTIFLLLFIMMANVSRAGETTHKIALIHSFEPGYSTGERAGKLLTKELLAVDLDCDIREYFLDCDFYGEADENIRMYDFIDDLSAWGADLIAVLDDQATYALMACGHPQIAKTPVVFSGVNYPNERMLQNFSNITGYIDIPDYLHTIRMIEKIIGKSRVSLIVGSTFLDRKIWSSLEKQCQGEDFVFIPDKDTKDYYEVYTRESVNPVLGWKKEKTLLDSTVIMRLTTDSIPMRRFAWLGNGTHVNTIFLYTKCDFTTSRVAMLFDNPCFETINEGFGSLDYMLGGYFTPLEVQMRYMAMGIKSRLQGHTVRQLTSCPKQHVLNWRVLDRYGISLDSIPHEYTVMYIPFYVRYHKLIIYGSILFSLIILFIITVLTLGYLRERRRKRIALHRVHYEHETLRLAIEGGTTYVWRLEDNVISCDPQFYELIHYPNARLCVEDVFSFIHPDDLDSFKNGFSLMKTRLQHKGQYRCRFSGEYQWWEFSYNTICNEKNIPIVAGLLRNVQDIKDREEELIEARQLAEKAEMKQSFLNNMSHEIRTPLNAIAGFSSMLVNTPELEEEEQQEFADIIDRNTRLLLKLVDDVLELSGVESDYQSFQFREENIRQLLEEFYKEKSSLVPAPLDFILDFPVEDVMVNVDAKRMIQVLINLLDNAGKFTMNGYVKLGYRLLSEANEVHIFVEDTGIGIAPNVQRLIFDRFYKYDEFSQGVGLGLSICQLIVEKMYGRIELKSQEGEGSCFTIVLPAIKL